MGFLPEHVNPVVLTLGALGLAALVDRRRWWLVGIPTLLGLTIGFLVDITGVWVHEVPLVPFMVEVATIAALGGLVFGGDTESMGVQCRSDFIAASSNGSRLGRAGGSRRR